MKRLAKRLFMTLLALEVAGCASVALQRQQEAWQQAHQISQECSQRRLSGGLSGHVASALCSTDRARQVIAASGYPHMDLVDLFFAYRMALAQRTDNGSLSHEEANLRLAELRTRLTSEEQ
jgi:hypothetical protein